MLRFDQIEQATSPNKSLDPIYFKVKEAHDSSTTHDNFTKI